MKISSLLIISVIFAKLQEKEARLLEVEKFINAK